MSQRVNSERAKALVEQGAILVDVRTKAEFGGGHLQNAKNIPVQELSARVDELDRSQPIVVYCRSGARSSSAARTLSSNGFQVFDLGPMHAWNGEVPALSRLMLPALACLTLGLAPFTPEPHLFGKLTWIAGGAVGMGPMDWFDFVMHGSPFVWFGLTLVKTITGRA